MLKFLEKLVYTHFGVSNRSQQLRASARKGTRYAVAESTLRQHGLSPIDLRYRVPHNTIIGPRFAPSYRGAHPGSREYILSRASNDPPRTAPSRVARTTERMQTRRNIAVPDSVAQKPFLPSITFSRLG
jgi:hypothetical protein